MRGSVSGDLHVHGDAMERSRDVEALLKEIEHEESSVNRKTFNEWMRRPEACGMLDSCEVDHSTRFELFDALDVTMEGELSVAEVVERLMMFRGPTTKLDVVATRLKVRYIVKQLKL